MMNLSEIKAYLLGELSLERDRHLCGLSNNYGYLYMLCNDMGLFEADSPASRREGFQLIDFTGGIAEM